MCNNIDVVNISVTFTDISPLISIMKLMDRKSLGETDGKNDDRRSNVSFIKGSKEADSYFRLW